jgi:hypothetical protein
VPLAQVTALEVESIRTINDRANKADARANKAEVENDDLKRRVKALEEDHSPRPAGRDWATGVGLLAVAGAIVFAATRRKALNPTAA